MSFKFKKFKKGSFKNGAVAVLLAVLAVLPPGVLAASSERQLALAVGDLLEPDKIFETLKQNLTFPLSKEQEIKIPAPAEALKEASPQLQEINKGVREETGIDFAKFIGWSAGILKSFLQIIIGLLEAVAEALRS